MKRKIINDFKTVIPAISLNESYCRSIAVAFASQCDPTIEEIADIKTIISEAVTNCIVHAYKNHTSPRKNLIYISCVLTEDNILKFKIKDKGCGIENIEKAMQPLFTTDTDNERSGMGIPIMQSFADSFRIKSVPGKGTTVVFTKKIRSLNDD